MENLDVKNMELRAKITEAVKSEDEGALGEAFVAMANEIQQKVISEARAMASNEVNDRMIMGQRGQSVLTAEERSYYKEVKEKRGLTGLDVTMPKSIFNRVFEYLVAEHPLLSKVDIINAEAVQEWILRTSECTGAAWGKLNSAIVQELEHGFKSVQTDTYKLSAFIPVAKDMLDLGAEWLDKYIRVVLAESIAIALEEAILVGSGKDQPIGMTKNLDGAVTGGVYSDKDTIALKDFSPSELGKMMAQLTKNGKRSIGTVTLIVNPKDYWEIIFPATAVLTQNGTYAHGVLPINADIVQSVSCPTGKMVAGIAKDYKIMLGSKDSIKFSDEYKFLEDQRVYATKMHANGFAIDNDAFIVYTLPTLAVAKSKKIG